MKVVINAGGLGTRISSFAPDVPKPMIKINNKPILEHQIECLKRQGFDDFIIITGYLKEQIEEYFSDGTSFGVNISYFKETEPFGTAGALIKLKDVLKEDFLFIFADIIFDIDFEKFISFHLNKKASISLFVHPNDHPYDSTLIKVDKDSKIEKVIPKESKRTYYKNLVNAGLHIVSPKVLNFYKPGEKLDFDRDILMDSVKEGVSFAYVSSEYVKDAGTEQRFKEVKKDILSGKVKERNYLNKQKAIFIDRDGTINKYKGQLCDADDFELIEGVAEAVKMINKSKFLAIVITNQPMIAKGFCGEKELQNIHDKMETLLGKENAYLDGIYYCPHHPDSGFEGEIKELKIKCTCRKPAPGLILQAAKNFNIDLSASYMVGDADIDVGAGLAAGCKAILVSNDKLKGYEEVPRFKNLKSFVSSLFSN